jgi:hypothetical protein
MIMCFLRGDTKVIEDVPALSDIDVHFNKVIDVNSVFLLPEEVEIPFQAQLAGGISFRIPKLTGHQMVLIRT